MSFRRLANHGWIQDQHGAWPMVVIPWLCGTLIAGFSAFHVLLLVAWVSAFHLFNVASLWMKARLSQKRRARYLPAVRFWAVLTVVFGVPVIVWVPAVVWWGLLFAAPLAVAVYESWMRRDRALAARGTSILASIVMLPLAAWVPAGVAQPWMGFSAWLSSLRFEQAGAAGFSVWAVSAVVCAYFLGTVPYVRSLIRGRRDRRWVAGAVVWHGVAVAVLVCGYFLGWGVPLSAIVVWVILLARSWAVPVAQQRGVNVRPAAIGIGEFVATIAVVATALAFSVA